jgi:hypothetical protein
MTSPAPGQLRSLYIAIRGNNPEKFNARLEAYQLPPNFQTHILMNPLLSACEQGAYKIIPLLLNEKEWFVADTELGKIALHSACTQYGRCRKSKLLLTLQAFLPWVKRVSTIKGVERGEFDPTSALDEAKSLGWTLGVNALNKRAQDIEDEMESRIDGSAQGEHRRTSMEDDVPELDCVSNDDDEMPELDCETDDEMPELDCETDDEMPELDCETDDEMPELDCVSNNKDNMPGLVRFSNKEDRNRSIAKIVGYSVACANAKAITMLYKHGLLSYATEGMDEIHIKVWNLIHDMSVTNDETVEKTFTRDWQNLRDVMLIDLNQNLDDPHDRIMIMCIIRQLRQRWEEHNKVTNKHPGSPRLIEKIVKHFAGDLMFKHDDVLELLDIAVTYDSDIIIEVLLHADLQK